MGHPAHPLMLACRHDGFTCDVAESLNMMVFVDHSKGVLSTRASAVKESTKLMLEGLSDAARAGRRRGEVCQEEAVFFGHGDRAESLVRWYQ